MKAAENNIQFVAVETPIRKAKWSLWRAVKNYAVGKKAVAAADLKDMTIELAPH